MGVFLLQEMYRVLQHENELQTLYLETYLLRVGIYIFFEARDILYC